MLWGYPVIITLIIIMKNRLFIIVSFCFCISAVVAQYSEWRDLLDKKQFGDVITQAGGLQPADSADFSKMYLLGQAYEGLLKYKEAYDCYKRCYTSDTTQTDLLNTLARVSNYIGKVKESEKYYKQVLRYDSADFYANYQLARLYVQVGNNREGMKYYNYLLEKDSGNPVILRAKGDCYTRMDSLFPAMVCYHEAYYKNVENAPLAMLLVNTLLNLHHPLLNDFAGEAMFVCDTALFYHPEDRGLRQKKAMIYYVKKDYVRSDSIYTQLLSEQDSSYITLKYCGCARYYSGKWDDAVEPLEKAFERDSSAYDVCLLLGASIGRTYDIKQAFQYFDKAEKLMEPDEYWSDILIQFRAEMFVKTGSCNKGAELYYRLWKKEKKQLSWLQNIQYCYARKNMEEMSDEDRQRSLFITYLYASEISEKQKKTEQLNQYMYLRFALEKFDEEMFFRGVDHLPMLSPDNRKNTLSKEKLKELLDVFPKIGF
jgi:tetratricopeptide (TPR) repeat protein